MLNNSSNLSKQFELSRGNLNGHLSAPYNPVLPNAVPSLGTFGTSVGHSCWCPTNQKIYIGNSSGGSGVIVFDPITNTVVATVSIGGSIGGAACCYIPSIDRIYFGMGTSGTIAVINPLTNTQVATISPTYQYAEQWAFNPNLNRLYTTNGAISGGGVSVIDVTTNSQISTFTLTSNYTAVLVYSPHSDKIYACTQTGVNIINPNTNSEDEKIIAGDVTGGGSVVWCPTNNSIYFDCGPATIKYMNCEEKVVRTVIAGSTSVSKIAYHPKKNLIFGSVDSTVYAIDPIKNKVVASYSSIYPRRSLVYCSLNDGMYLHDYSSGTMYLV